MTRGRLDKKIPALEPFFENVLVCNDKNLRPFIEIFVHEPENVAQQKLGTLLGIFEVDDDSEDSSYIVNYLISVIKKEYFSNPKNGPIESFEMALHKANLALSKLAEHDNIKWIGKLNSLVAVIEKNSLHLSQAGTASAFLLRSSTLTDISEGLSEYGLEPHPLKTFTNVSSGKLETHDKLIIATENIFDIFSFEEIKKSALRFSNEQFVQFLKTALGNELQKAAALVIDIKEKQEAPVPENKNQESVNAFSQSAFYKPSTRKNAPPAIQDPIPETTSEPKEKNTGHLYIRESEEIAKPKESFNFSKYSTGAKQKTQSFFTLLLKLISATASKLKNLTVHEFQALKFKVKNQLAARKQRKEQALAAKSIIEEIPPVSIEPTVETVRGTTSEPTIKESLSIQQFYERPAQLKTEESFGKIFLTGLKNSWKKSVAFFSGLLPKFSHLKKAFGSLNYQQKLYSILVILAIIIIPIFIVKAIKRAEPAKVEPVIETPIAVPVPLEQDKNVSRVDTLNAAYTGSEIVRVIELNGKIFIVTNAQVINLENQERFPVPNDFGKIDLASSMDDLNFIFIFNKATKKILSWSPISKKFQTNTISIPENADIVAADTYLTYLYLVDAQNNQIYRYPRAEGGFGERADWKKDSTDISATTAIAINENLFAASSENIFKFYRGKKQDYAVEETATPFIPYHLYTKRDNENLYVLDKENSRIVKLSKEGQIITQYYNAEIKKALDFTVNEPAGNIYFTSDTTVNSFSL